jgi:NusA N-terminal domain
MGVGTGVPLFLVCGLRVFMNAEFIAMLDYLERERGIKREILLEAVSNALLSASKKSVGRVPRPAD